ncbi:phosphate ABC transporter substrate-binding protein PstS [Streptomyces purpurogeneiscleroticus]|uniref:phosphate ABC transporter substrate-binding protein PstS n=1 Tax=Streptomyces purpurogeneiscleroticus TaxID=68259 RepID=UPI001CC1688E|nr:phosphate ABC transporter substrate-binding protein PstS [Streptomyces purpurogeneiscleroticus]MBZ4015714.1 phosphate ABC transporter substrate-binding protein PstS [Streptomyces purpurogeneiscleroticus]
MTSQRSRGPRALATALAALSGVLALASCGSDDSPESGGSASATSASGSGTAAPGGAVKCGKAATLRASGSTAQQNAMRFWIRHYQKACDGTRIQYEGSGSGDGQKDFLAGRTAFAGSDSVLKKSQRDRAEKACADGGRAVHLPMLGGPIAVPYNLSGVEKLVLDAPTLARIFDGKITKWNDAAIRKLNPKADLPATAIKTVHRSDDSGTTDNFTAYLHTATPSAWPHPRDQKWRGKGGDGADGSSGLAAKVKETEGAIGYVELAYAIGKTLPTASIDTGAAAPVDPTVVNASKALSGAKVAGSDGDLVLDLDYQHKTAGAYPIGMVTYEIVCDKGNEPKTWPATKAFLLYAAGMQGQQDLSFQGYATLPAKVMDKVRDKLNSIS